MRRGVVGLPRRQHAAALCRQLLPPLHGSGPDIMPLSNYACAREAAQYGYGARDGRR